MKTICHVILVVLAALLWATASSTRASALLFSQYDNQSTYGPSLVRPADGVHAGVADDFNALMMFAETQSLNLLPGDAAIAPAAGDQTAPAIAQGGNLLLAVWTDNRSNPYPSGFYAWSEYETSRDIYGVRLDTAGNVLDAVPIAIAARRSNQNYPRVCWNGANWLVVYQSVDVGGTGYYAQDSFEAVRVAPTGQVLDAKPIKLYGLTASNSSYWTLASDGNNWVVVNQGNSTSSDIVAVRISAAGVVLDPPTRVLVPATYYGRFNLKLAHASGVFALTYSDEYINGNNNTKLLRFDSNLTKLDAAPLTLLDVSLSDLAGNGASFYIVWNRQEPNGLVHVVGSRVSTDGVKLDGTGVNISGTKEPGYGSITAVVWDGVNWRVTWSDITTFWIARINTAGVVLDPGSVAVAGVQTGPTAGNGAGGLQVIWIEFPNINYDVFTANISPGNVAGPSRTLSVGAPQQTQPDIATSGDGYMMVYRSAISTQGRVLAQPLDAAGNPLTAEPIQLDSGLNINGPGNPNVAWNGSLYLVSWGCAQRDRRPTLVGHRCQAGRRAVHGDERLFRLGGCGCIGKRLSRHRAEGRHQHSVHQPGRSARQWRGRGPRRFAAVPRHFLCRQSASGGGVGRSLAHGVASQRDPRQLVLQQHGRVHQCQRYGDARVPDSRTVLDRRRQRHLRGRSGLERQHGVVRPIAGTHERRRERLALSRH